MTLALFFFSAINVRRFFVSVRSVPPLHIITTFLLMVVLFLLDDHPYQLQKVIKYAAYVAIILQLMQLDQNILARIWNGAGCTCFCSFFVIHSFRRLILLRFGDSSMANGLLVVLSAFISEHPCQTQPRSRFSFLSI